MVSPPYGSGYIAHVVEGTVSPSYQQPCTVSATGRRATNTKRSEGHKWRRSGSRSKNSKRGQGGIVKDAHNVFREELDWLAVE